MAVKKKLALNVENLYSVKNYCSVWVAVKIVYSFKILFKSMPWYYMHRGTYAHHFLIRWNVTVYRWDNGIASIRLNLLNSSFIWCMPLVRNSCAPTILFERNVFEKYLFEITFFSSCMPFYSNEINIWYIKIIHFKKLL